MKYRPIIMGAESVRAILEGRKTQTRRVIKPQPSVSYHWSGDAYEEGGMVKAVLSSKPTIHFDYMPKCRWQVGDRLWVRETWAEPHYWTNDIDAETPIYRECDRKEPIKQVKWKSPMFMPRWASRVTLEITDIRIERVQDISEEDALAEGIISNEEYEARASEDNLFPCPRCRGYQIHEAFGYDYGITEVDCTYCDTQKKRYRIVWDSLNAKRGYPWESNPWVWVIIFKRVSEC